MWFQRSLLQAETDKEKVETEILKQQEKMEMLQCQINNAQKDKDNFQSEMEILLDRINKLSDMVDKSRVIKSKKNPNKTSRCAKTVDLDSHHPIHCMIIYNIIIHYSF